jgi:isopropylmalate/homocitrate/citramalate synthase
MGKVSLLDCTLRDGGYVNDWRFGETAIPKIVKKLIETGVEIIELGFLKNEPYSTERTVFSREEQIEQLIHPKKNGVLYAGMVEVVSPLPINELIENSNSSIDVIRVLVWKRLLDQGFEYCREILAKGYKICIQPARVNQYSEREFINMIELFNTIKPMAVYVVDSWGTQSREATTRYLNIADKYLKKDIALGYHGHNNMQQAFSCAEAFVNMGFERDIIIDASIYGMGRGAGNLTIEMFATHLNKTLNKSYRLEPMLEIYSEFIEPIYRQTAWGYSVAHLLTALYDCNPNYANYLSQEKGLSSKMISEVLRTLSEQDKIIFSPDAVKNV